MTYIVNDNGVNREMTPNEKAQYDAFVKIALQEEIDREAAMAASAAAKISARAKLKALGLTDDEIAALVG